MSLPYFCLLSVSPRSSNKMLKPGIEQVNGKLKVIPWFLGMATFVFFFSVPAVFAQLEHYSAASKNLETILTDLRTKSSEIKEQNSILAVKNGILRKQLWERQQELKSDFIEKQELQAEFRRLDDCLRNEITIVQLLERKLNGLRLIIAHHEENDSQWRSDIDRKKNEIDALHQEVKSLNREIIALENQLKMSKNSDTRTWDARKKELAVLLAESSVRNDKKREELENLRRESELLKSQISGLANILGYPLDSLPGLKEGKSLLQVIEQKKREEDMDFLDQELISLKQRRADLVTLLDSIPHQNPQEQKMPEQFKIATNQLRSIVKSNKASQLILKEKVQELKSNIYSEKKEIARLKSKADLEKAGSVSDWDTKKAARIKMLTEKLNLSGTKKKEIVSHQREMEDLTKSIDGLLLQQKEYNEKIEQMERDIQVSRNEETRMVGASQFSSERRKENFNILDEENKSLQAQQDELKAFLSLIHDQLNDDRKITDVFVKEEKQLESNIRFLKGENESLLRLYTKLKFSFQEMDPAKDDLYPLLEKK